VKVDAYYSNYFNYFRRASEIGSEGWFTVVGIEKILQYYLKHEL
jgi:hypothetical protein